MALTNKRTTTDVAFTAPPSVETHGIDPVPADRRYGRPARLFSVWFAPNMNITAVFTGSLGIGMGLSFAATVSAIVVGTITGSAVTAYLGTWGPRTGSAQLPLARLPFGRGVIVPGILAWFSAIAWDALIGIFGGQALHELTGVPLWAGITIVLALEAVVGFFGYEVIHRFQVISSYLLGLAFLALTVKIAGMGELPVSSTVHGSEQIGTWWLIVAISFSLGISWAPYASDFARYMPAATSAPRIFAFTLAGMGTSYIWLQVLGAAAAASVGVDETAAGVRTLLGGGWLGTIGLWTIVLACVSSNAMNDYSGSLSMQTIGLRISRPFAALVVGALALALCLWMSAGAFADRFQNLLLLVSYWIPCFVAVVLIDWRSRIKGAHGHVDVDEALRHPSPGWPAVVALLAGMASTLLFMNTTLWEGPFARMLAGADMAYYVGFLLSAIVFAALRRFGTTPAL